MASEADILLKIRQLQDKLRIAQNGLAKLNPNLEMNQAILARYRNEVATIPSEIAALEAQLGGTQNSQNKPSPTKQRTNNKVQDDSAVIAPVGEGTTISGTGETKPQGNVLDKFASYTYQASVYLLTTGQYNQLMASGKKNVNGYNLLFQSGGAPNNVGGPQGANSAAAQAAAQSAAVGGYDDAQTPTIPGPTDQDAGRNPFFPVDYYIDSITINNNLVGKATGAAHMVTDMKFSVVEPANITLLDKLYQAVQDIGGKDSTGAINYTAATYLMVIRFYGYDEKGNIVRVGAADSATGVSDSNAVIEKFIPFIIKKINWSVSSKLVTYDFECGPVGQFVGTSTRRGTIPFDLEISDSTVGGILVGKDGYSSITSTPATGNQTDRNQSPAETQRLAAKNASASSPVKADAAPTSKKTVKQGLMSAMNEFQQQLVKDKVYNVADVYEIVFVNDRTLSIKDSKVTKPSTKVNKKSTPMSPAASQDTKSVDPDRSSMDISVRNFKITAGMQIVQIIDLIVRNSSYITDQALTIFDEETGLQKLNPNAKKSDYVKWFSIAVETKQLEYDAKRNDHAYKITYIVRPYKLTNFDSTYFPASKFSGIHKRYPWWFTGENSQVIDYTATFNTLYNITVSGSAPDNSAAVELKKKYTSSMRDIPKITFQTTSTESNQGADGKANEIGANAAEYLYSPSDLAKCKLKILGDPAWIQQGSISGGATATELGYNSFLPDGTINFDAEQIMFEIVWQRPEDYDMNTGLADPYSRTASIFGDRQPIQSTVYQAVKCTSEFSKGSFYQTIEGTLYYYPIPSGANKAISSKNNGSRDPNQTAETARRTGVSLTPQRAQAARRTFAQNDPRRTDRVTAAPPAEDFTSVDVMGNQTGFSNSAQLQTAGTNNAKAAPRSSLEPSQSSGQFPSAAPGPKDTAAPLPPPRSPTSNGDTVPVRSAGTGSITVEGITLNPGDPGYDDALSRLSQAQRSTELRFAGRVRNKNLNTPPDTPSQPQIGARDY